MEGSAKLDLDQLQSENTRLREALGISGPKPYAVESVTGLEKENEMLAHQLALLNKNNALLDVPDGRLEALYKLQFLDSIPLPTWSANIQAKIVHWGGTAARTYGFLEEKALGRDFIELFVTEPEKKQARNDLGAIIFGQEGLEHFNLCKDKDKAGKQVYLVTCCFPVFDVRTSEVVQAEVSFDLSQLKALEEELEEMHHRYRAEEDGVRARRQAKERTIIEALTRELFVEVKGHYDHRRTVIERGISLNREKLSEGQVSARTRAFHESELGIHLKDLAELDKWEADAKAMIAGSDTHQELDLAKAEIRAKIRSNV